MCGRKQPWMLSHSRGSVDSAGLRHTCWESLHPHWQSSRVKAYFISLGGSFQGQVPHLLENPSGLLLNLTCFCQNLGFLFFIDTTITSTEHRQPLWISKTSWQEDSHIWLRICQNESWQTLLMHRSHHCWTALSLKREVTESLQHWELVIIEVWKYFTEQLKYQFIFKEYIELPQITQKGELELTCFVAEFSAQHFTKGHLVLT